MITQPAVGFYRRQSLWLLASACLLLLLFELTRLDYWISNAFYDAASRTFPLQNAWFLETVVHKWVKYALLTLAVGLGVQAWRTRGSERRFYLFLVAGMLLAPTVVSLLKAISDRPCPWDTLEYGGSLPHLPLWQSLPVGLKPGHCFPGGHASGGFGLLVFWFWGRQHSSRRAALLWSGALLLGLLMGWSQVARGAHFLSHNLWSAWVCWAVIVALHALCYGRKAVSLQPSEATLPE